MCFKAPDPDIPEAPPVPNKNNEETAARQEAERMAASQAQGRQATILTSPLGVPGNPDNRRRTTIRGL